MPNQNSSTSQLLYMPSILHSSLLKVLDIARMFFGHIELILYRVDYDVVV
jgi:hypothetical protein